MAETDLKKHFIKKFLAKSEKIYKNINSLTNQQNWKDMTEKEKQKWAVYLITTKPNLTFDDLVAEYSTRALNKASKIYENISTFCLPNKQLKDWNDLTESERETWTFTILFKKTPLILPLEDDIEE